MGCYDCLQGLNVLELRLNFKTVSKVSKKIFPVIVLIIKCDACQFYVNRTNRLASNSRPFWSNEAFSMLDIVLAVSFSPVFSGSQLF